MSKQIHIQEALENVQSNLGLLSSYSDAELDEKLDTIHLRTDIAIQKNNTTSLQLLEVWRNQVIAARLHKAKSKIPDAPSEIELAIVDIETTVARSEARYEADEEYMNPVKKSRPKAHEKQDDESQLSMF